MTVVSVLSKVPNLIKELKHLLPNLVFHEINLPENIDRLKNSEILVTDFDLYAPFAYDLKQVKWVQGTFAGIDGLKPHVDFDNPPNYVITRFSGSYFAQTMMEYVLASVINNEKSFYELFENQKNKIWDDTHWEGANARNLTELVFGIMGVGHIGNSIGRTLNTLGAKVLGYGRSAKPALETSYMGGYFTGGKLPDLLKECDYIVNVLPHTNETIGLLNGNVLENCKEKQAIFINIGRGSIIREQDLVNALERKWLRAAVLDVFETEPLPKESKLWSLPQVLITPHVAGKTRAKEVAETFKENFKLFTENKPIPLTIDFKRGY